MNQSPIIDQVISENKLDMFGTEITFEDMHHLMARLVVDTNDDEAPKKMLYQLLKSGLKPAFSSTGYTIVNKESLNIIGVPPKQFMLGDPFISIPKSSTQETFFPLLDVSRPELYYTHQIRWFRHPFRPNIRIPLRFNTFRLSDPHPSSRMYVDLPVIVPSDSDEIHMFRLSALVFDRLAFEVGANSDGYWSLSRSRNRFNPAGAHWDIKKECDASFDLCTHNWALFERLYVPYAKTAEVGLSNLPDYKTSALIVADHIVRMEG